MIRAKRIQPQALKRKRKSDGSYVTILEEALEHTLQEYLQKSLPAATLIGEESGGGAIPKRGLALAIDPLDGTWSFLGHSETCSTSLAFFQDGKAFLGMVMNPATGEIGYAFAGAKTRLVQLSLFREGDSAVYLPTSNTEQSAKCLVNLHPSSSADHLHEKLYPAWQKKNIRLIKGTGGSPAWSLLETAKGHYNYINLWSKHPAAPYDLAAGILLVLGAGGKVVNFSGEDIPLVGHLGPFLAGVNPQLLATLLKLIN